MGRPKAIVSNQSYSELEDLPKTIFTYWHQGFDKAPRLVRLCIAQVRRLHPDWEIHLLDEHSISDFIDEFPMPSYNREGISLAAWSDLVRLQLLLKYGGVWMDPTVFCARPLGSWLPGLMDSGIFLFSRPGRDRLIASWFIAAVPSNPWLKEVDKLLRRYWGGRKFRNLGRDYSPFEGQLSRIINRNVVFPRIWFSPLFTKLLPVQPYFFFHYALAKTAASSEIAGQVWNAMPKRTADGPHRLLRIGLNERITDEARDLIQSQESMVFKLNWKQVPDRFPEGTVIATLEAIALSGPAKKTS